MSEEKFKLPGSSYDEVVKIIKAYGRDDKPTTNEEISKLTGLHPTMVSRNNGFLVAVGIVDGNTGRTKIPTALGRKLARALEFDRADEISSAWRSIVIADEFLSKMLAAVRIRKGMDESTLENHIAYSAGSQKSSNVMAGASTIVDILRRSEILIEKEGRLIAVDTSQFGHTEEEQVKTPSTNDVDTEPSINDQRNHEEQKTSHEPSPGGHFVSLRIELRIDAKPSELDGLGSKLRQLIKEVSMNDRDINVDIRSEYEVTE